MAASHSCACSYAFDGEVPPAGTRQERWPNLNFGLSAIVGPRQYERLLGCRCQALSWRAVWDRAFGPRKVAQ